MDFDSFWANGFLKVSLFLLLPPLLRRVFRFRSEINQKIRSKDSFFVMLHHNDGITKAFQRLQGFYQAVSVPFVQADCRLVQNIKRSESFEPICEASLIL